MECLAVVPIVVNVSAALLPTLLTLLASVGAILLRPWLLLSLMRRCPARAALLLLALLIFAGLAVTTAGKARRPKGTTPESLCDWAQVARDLIAQEQLRGAPTPSAGSVSHGASEASTTAEARISLLQDFSRSGFAGGVTPRQLSPLWTYRPPDTLFLSTPLLIGDRLFVAGCQSDLGGYTGILACLDRRTGRVIWEVTDLKGKYLLPFFSSPAASGDGRYLLIGQGLHTDRACALLCFETETGRLHWRVETPLHIESSPAVHGDLVVVGAGAIEDGRGRAQGDPGYCLAVRISDGQELWRYPVNDPESSPAIDDAGIVYIGSGMNGQAVVALRSEAGDRLEAQGLDRLVWQRALSQPITGPITLVGDTVLAGGGTGDVVHSGADARGMVVALDRDTGAIRWECTFADAALGGVACRNDWLFCPLRTGEVVALSLENGEERWRRAISGQAPVLAGCAVTDRAVYAVSSDGFLAVLDIADGEVLERMALNDPSRPGSGLTLSRPLIAGGQVFVGSETGGFHCLTGTSMGDAPW